MALLSCCSKGHTFVQADVYHDWPEDAPHCPACYEEWYKEKFGHYTSNYDKVMEEQKRYELCKNLKPMDRVFLLEFIYANSGSSFHI